MGYRHWNYNQFVIPHAASALTAHELKAAPAAGLKYYITDIEFYQGGTSVQVDILSATTVIWSAKPAISGQASAHFQIPIMCGALEALNLTCGTSTSAFIVICGFTARS